MKALIVLFTFFNAIAVGEHSNIDVIKKVVAKFGESTGVEMTVQKTVKLSLLGESTTSNGKIHLAKGKLRIELGEPDNSLIIFNDREIWMISPTPKELGGKLQVSKVVSKKMQSQARAPLALLLAKESAWDEFKIKNESKKDGLIDFILVPKNKKNFPDVAEVKVVISSLKNELKEIAVLDDIENETQFKLLDVSFDKKIALTKFNYRPPGDAEVTVYE